MAINRYTKRTPVAVNFYTPPLQVIGEALKLKQAAYLRNVQLADELANQQISALTPDRAKANAIVQGYQRQIDEAAKNYDGDYSKMSKDLYRIASNIRKDFSPGGEAYAIQSNYSAYNDWLKRHQDLIKSKVIRPEQLNLASNYILQNYQGIGKVDPLTQTYNTINTVEVVPYVDIQKKAMDAAKEVVAEKGGYETWTLANGYIWGKKGGKWEKVTPERIQDVVIRSIANSPDIEAYVSQSRMFGYDPLSEDRLKSLIQQGITTYAYNNTWSTSDLKFDPLGVKQIQDQLENEPHMRYMPTMDPASKREPMSTSDIPLVGDRISRPEIQGNYLTGEYTSNMDTYGFNDKEHFYKSRGSGMAQKLEDVVSKPEFKKKFGQFGVDLYQSLNKAGRFNGLTEQEKRNIYVKEFNQAYESNHRQPLVYSYGAKTMDKATKEIGSMLQNLTFDYVHPDGKVEEGLTLTQMYQRMKGKWFNPSQKTLEEFQAEMLKGTGPRITGLTQSASGVNVGHILEGPGMNGYAIVRGYDATWDNEAKPLLELSAVAQSVNPKESNWVLLPNSMMEVKAIGRPTFDPNTGKYVKTDTQFKVRFIGENGERTPEELDPSLTLEQLQEWVSQTSNQKAFTHKTDNVIQF